MKFATILWIVWVVWIAVHSYIVPSDPAAVYEGELLPLPYWREAATRAVLAMTGAGVVLLAAWGAGALALVRWRDAFRDRAERCLFELGAGFSALSLSLLALAAAGLYTPPIVRVAVLLAAAGASWLLWKRLRAIDRMWRTPEPGEMLFVVMGAGGLAFALLGALAPEIEYDALWYHLWIPQQWLEAGRPVDLLHEYPSLYPQTWELLFGAAMTLGGPVAAKLLHFVCLPLVGFATWKLAALVTESRSARAAAAAVAVVSPTIIWEAASAYVDLALAFYVALSAQAVLRHTASRDPRWLVLTGVMLGTGAAIKHLGLVAGLSTALMLLALERRHLRHAIRACAIVALVAVLFPLPWYARAYAASGNPVFPDLFRVFGAEPAERWSDDTERALGTFKTRFGRPRTAANLIALPWDVTTHGARYGGAAGPAFLMLMPLGFLAGRSARVLLLGCLVYLAVWASPLSSFQFRFLVPILPLLAVAGAAGLRFVPRVIAAAVLLPVLLLNLPPFTAWHERDRRGDTGWLTHVMRLAPIHVVTGSQTAERYLEEQVPSYRAWRFINATVPEDARVLTFSGGDHLYSRRNRLWSNAAAAVPVTWGALRGEERTVEGRLAQLGLTHVLVDKRVADQAEARALAITSERMRTCCFEALYEDGRFVLYRVR